MFLQNEKVSFVGDKEALYGSLAHLF